MCKYLFGSVYFFFNNLFYEGGNMKEAKQICNCIVCLTIANKGDLKILGDQILKSIDESIKKFEDLLNKQEEEWNIAKTQMLENLKNNGHILGEIKVVLEEPNNSFQLVPDTKKNN